MIYATKMWSHSVVFVHQNESKFSTVNNFCTGYQHAYQMSYLLKSLEQMHKVFGTQIANVSPRVHIWS